MALPHKGQLSIENVLGFHGLLVWHVPTSEAMKTKTSRHTPINHILYTMALKFTNAKFLTTTTIPEISFLITELH